MQHYKITKSTMGYSVRLNWNEIDPIAGERKESIAREYIRHNIGDEQASEFIIALCIQPAFNKLMKAYPGLRGKAHTSVDVIVDPYYDDVVVGIMYMTPLWETVEDDE